MMMHFSLEQYGYAFQRETGLWMRPDYAGIAYSDGDETENRLAEIIAAHDPTLHSTELRQHISDWPSRYHLSPVRANILRPFVQRLAGKNVLEIGAGCGAISRYLGEIGAHVLAVEGSPRRAAIARSRTRDLPNVTVLCEDFSHFQPEERFDAVTLVGVLEYAPLFFTGDDPVSQMLMSVRSHLVEHGELLLAIENQLGLKYFAGSNEDHLGRPMYGLEGRYTGKQPCTFGKVRLSSLLRCAGFAGQEFFAPFPDYKFPVSIVTEQGLTDSTFDASAFAWQSARLDPQLPTDPHFSLELTWPEIVANGLLMDMANSFLVRARLANTSPFAPEILTYHYSADRQNAFCKETRFLRDRNSESISVCCQRLYDAPSPDSGPLRFHPQMTDVYYQGKTLSWHMLRLLSADGWTDAEFINLLLRYLHILEEYLAASSTPVLISSSDIMLPGACFDIIPQNIVVASQGDWRIIDHEWSMTREISAGYLLFRAVWTVMGMLSRFGLPNDQHVVTRFDLLVVAFQALHSFIDKEHLMAYLRQEIEMAAFVAGYEQRSDEVASWLDASLPTEHFFLQQYQQQQAAINQQSQYITTLTTRLKQLVARWSKREASIDTALASLERMQTDLPQVSSLHRSFLTKWQEFRLLRTFPETRFLFDEIWYRNRYADVGDVGTSALRHYVFHGSDKEYDPSPYFHASWYVRRYPDTASTNPLLHFIQRGAAEGRNPSPYFDTVWYRSQYSQAAGRNPFAHYLEKWREEGTSPHPCFDAVWYIGNYADVARSGGEPLSHYLTFGAKEGRNPHPLFDTAWYLWRYPRAAEYPTPLLHFLAFGKLEGLSPGPYFDSDWYVGQYRDILGDEEPFRHFLEHWRTTDCNPNPCFDCDWYRGRYPDVENSGMNPLTHYVMFGEKEGWMPCIHFDPSWYIETNPTVTPSGKGAFRHFMETGLRAWLNPNPDFDTDWFIRQYPQAADSDLPPFLYFLKKGKTENLSPRENLTIEQYYRNRHENTSMPR